MGDPHAAVIDNVDPAYSLSRLRKQSAAVRSRVSLGHVDHQSDHR
jgi:hypothetical protein